MQLAIRRACRRDARSVASLYLRARLAAAAAGAIPAPVHDDHDVRDWISRRVIPELNCWLAETPSGTPVGMLVLDGEWIDQLYVDPDLTGRGIGTALLVVAKRERPQRLRLWTFVSNPRAQRFYSRHGFIEVARTDGAGNEERAPDIQYEWAWASSAP